MLRLAHPAALPLPSREELGGWVQRAVNALKTTAVPMFKPSEFTAG